jgi:hypothetical protein
MFIHNAGISMILNLEMRRLADQALADATREKQNQSCGYSQADWLRPYDQVGEKAAGKLGSGYSGDCASYNHHSPCRNIIRRSRAGVVPNTNRMPTSSWQQQASGFSH